MSNLLTTKQIAERTNKHHSMVRRAIANGWLNATTYGHTNLVSEDDFNAWLAAGATVYPKKSEEKTNSDANC